MKWEDIKPPVQREPSPFLCKLNGAADKIHGYDDGEFREAHRGHPDAQSVSLGDEMEHYQALQGTNIY